MKKRKLTYLLLTACLLTAACTHGTQQAGAPTADTVPAPAVKDSMQLEVFEGSVKAGEDTAYWRASIWHMPHSGNGDSFIRIAHAGKCLIYKGKRYTLRGTDDDPNATVWQCKTNDTLYFNFLVENDSTLRLLSKAPQDEEANDTLRLKRPSHPQTDNTSN